MQRRYFNPGMRRAAGFTLVELMVALAISLLLLTGVVAIFASSRSSYESTDQLSRIQETGRFGLDLMSRHIRASGFSGCSRQPNYVSTALNSATSLQWNFLGGPVQGFDADESSWTPALGDAVPDIPATDPGSVTAGSDVLVVRGPRLGVRPALVTVPMAGATSALTVDSTTSFNPDGEVVMAYSCEGQSVFVATPAGNTLTHGIGGATPGNEFDTTNFPFRANAEVVPVETVVYYVGRSSGDDLPEGTTSLWRRAALKPAEELLPGVEQMQIEYGIDTSVVADRIVDNYVDASAVTNWDRVVVVRIALLVRSVQEYGNDLDTRTYTLLNNDPVPAANDRRLREVFTTTVSIRNRVRVE